MNQEPRVELKLCVQVIALSVLWILAYGLTAFVFWQAKRIAEDGRRFSNECLVYTILLVGLPLPLCCLNIRLLSQLSDMATWSRPETAAFVAFLVLLCAGMVVLLAGGYWAINQTGEIRE